MPWGQQSQKGRPSSSGKSGVGNRFGRGVCGLNANSCSGTGSTSGKFGVVVFSGSSRDNFVTSRLLTGGSGTGGGGVHFTVCDGFFWAAPSNDTSSQVGDRGLK